MTNITHFLKLYELIELIGNFRNQQHLLNKLQKSTVYLIIYALMFQIRI